MMYERFIEEFNFDSSDSERMKMYDFACLKVARISLNDLLEKNELNVEVKKELERVLKLLNAIHANNAQTEIAIKNEFKKERLSKEFKNVRTKVITRYV